MTFIAINDSIAQELAHMAFYRAVEPSVLVEKALREFLQTETEQAIEQEATVFHKLHPELLATIPNQYAAIYQGKLVDHDPDQLALYLRIEKTYPDLPVMIRQVRPEVEQVLNVVSFRFENA